MASLRSDRRPPSAALPAVLLGAAAGIGLAMWGRKSWNASHRENLRGEVVLITGGSRGLGLAMAEEFARHGARIVICARDQEELERARMLLRERGANDVLALPCDVTKKDAVEKLIQHARDSYGQIDILVNNAGVIATGPLESQSLEDFRMNMDVNFWGAVYPTLAVLPEMRERRSGKIVNITSIGGKIAVPHLLPYTASKFALVGFSEGLHAECKRFGINVTTVVPGLMRTGSHLNAFFKGDPQKEFAWFSAGATSPFTAINAQRAARAVVEAVRLGKAEVVLGIPYKLAARVNGLMPATVSLFSSLVNRLLPNGTDAHLRRGWESQSRTSRILSAPGSKAVERYNQSAAAQEPAV